MIIEEKITIKNYKCFDEEGSGFERIMPLNILIGRNNSGKSSLLDLIEYITSPKDNELLNQNSNIRPNVTIKQAITIDHIEKGFTINKRSEGHDFGTDKLFAKTLIGKKVSFSFFEGGKQLDEIEDYHTKENPFPYHLLGAFQNMINVINYAFQNKIFCKISAERDVLPEKQIDNDNFYPNGNQSTNLIQRLLNQDHLDRNLIEKILLDDLNKIIAPEILFHRIFVMKDNSEKWQVYFEDEFDNHIALSKMGSGVKTILLVLLNLLIRPKIENKNPSNYVFAFEELENNLHPSMQRKLYNYIQDYSITNSAYFFLTTHSNTVIDVFSTDNNSQIIHVENKYGIAKVNTVISFSDNKNILRDLDIRASDLLQSNGVIWVEGPSDRNYLNRWLELIYPTLKEGIHFSIMFYGGKLLSNLTFDYESLNKTLIPLLKINTNAFVIMDRDSKGPLTKKLNKTKERVIAEIGSDNFWVTKGREIENYLSSENVSKWLEESHGIEGNYIWSKYEKIENNIINSYANISVLYNKNKTTYSNEIVKYISRFDIKNMDLEIEIMNLANKICEWNVMPPLTRLPARSFRKVK